MNDDLDARIAQLQGLIGEDEETLARAQQLRARAQPQDATAPRFAKDSDDRSVYVSGLPRTDETPEEIGALFADCGPILKVTVLRDHATQQLKGSAYVEFATFEAAGRALDTKRNVLFRGTTPLTVGKKRSFFAANRGAGAPRGRGRGGAGDPMQALMGMMGMMAAAAAGGARGGRGRGGRGFAGRGAPRGGGFSPFQ